MPATEFIQWRQKVLLGVNLRVVVPTGQYDPTELISWGSNRWALKPEFGYPRRWGNWILDGYAGAWFFTTNHDYIHRMPPFRGHVLSQKIQFGPSKPT